MSAASLKALYDALKVSAKKDLRSATITAELAILCEESIEFVRKSANFVPLISGVPGKGYGMLRLKGGTRSSRPINTALFDRDVAASDLAALLAGETSAYSEERLSQLLYTAAMSFCVAVDLSGGEGQKSPNQKSPGTFFEILVGHLAAMKLGVNPAKKVAVPTSDGAEADNMLPTDFIFDLGPGKSKVHMPVKISTRERVVQAWAHQRVLEGMLGAGRYKGVLVILTETNKQKDVSVVEVCLPGQWRAYQMYIAPMYRVYYLDVPKKYEPLRDSYPFIQIWPFAKFFSEYRQIQSPNP
ncbi:MAG TPA: hypothetical protein VGO01_04350 [Bradyrhizobium sp.]|nr:hypothetical protein [Bradyrhizobium sp.]